MQRIAKYFIDLIALLQRPFCYGTPDTLLIQGNLRLNVFAQMVVAATSSYLVGRSAQLLPRVARFMVILSSLMEDLDQSNFCVQQRQSGTGTPVIPISAVRYLRSAHYEWSD
jgi:hypothetical protein